MADEKSSRSAVGQTEKNSVRAYVVRFAPELGHCSMQSALRICARSGHEDCRSRSLKVARFSQFRSPKKLSIGRKASTGGILSSACMFEHQGYGKAASHCMIGPD